jgi:Clp amino terminal domain, pathogenicity island component
VIPKNHKIIFIMSLYERFTERARKVFLLANQEALRLKHGSVGTEHILLSLLKGDSGVATNALKNLLSNPFTIAMEVERLIHPGIGTSIANNLPRTPDVERVIQYAIEEAHNFNHNYLGSEHIFLGLLHEQEGVAARVLRKYGLKLDDVRLEITRILQHPADDTCRKSPGANISTQLSIADKEFILGVYRRAVDFYQSRIEKKTGVMLGNIGVYDYAQLPEHKIVDRERRNPWLVRIFRRIFLKHQIEQFSLALAARYADNAHKCAAAYYKNAIYVSFTDKTAHENSIAVTAVHELSHALWERIEGEPLDRNWSNAGHLAGAAFQKFRLLVEGYASYAERIWFVDLYPPSARDVLPHAQLDPSSIHYQGMHMVQQLVEKHGTEILLEIPKRWRKR